MNSTSVMEADQLELLMADDGRSVTAAVRVPSLAEAVHVSTTKIGVLPNGAAGRINVENRHLLAESGLTPGTHVTVQVGEDYVFVRRVERGTAETLLVAPKAFVNRDGSETVGSRIDLRRTAFGLMFGPDETLLVAYCPGGVLITRLPTRRQAQKRWQRLVAAAAVGRLSMGSLFTGIGTLDAALEQGLAESGVRVTNLWANDNWQLALEAMLSDNPARPASALAIGIEQIVALAADRPLVTPDFVAMGIPCKGASKLNIRDREMPELHPVVGHQVLNVAMLLQALNHGSPLLLVENVVPWSETVSCSMLTRVLQEQGYAVALIGDQGEGGVYRGLNGADFGDFERRKRMALLAYPPELEKYLDWSRMRRLANARTVGEIRAPEAQVDPAEYEKGAGLAAKAERRFVNQVVDDSVTSTPPMSSEAWKIRPEDPKFRHPTDPKKSRLPLPEEHARLKGQPEKLIRSIRHNSNAHTALGNGTTRRLWVEFGRALGLALKDAAAGLPMSQAVAA